MIDKEQRGRRKAEQRRINSERRRGADDRHVVIEVCPSELRLAMTVQGNHGKKPLLVTRKVPWGGESASLLMPSGRKELAAAIKQVATEERLGGCEAVVLLGGALCVTRTATANISVIDSQLKELEERGQLYLSLGVGQVAMAKRLYPLDARHTHALLSLANQRVIGAVAEASHDAGLSLKRVESSMVSLCRAHHLLHPADSGPVLLINLYEKGLSLGVAHQGRLVLEYLPGGSPAAAESPAIVEKHLSRIQRFCGRMQIGGADAIQRVYLSGDHAAVQAAARAFAAQGRLTAGPLVNDRVSERWESRETIDDPSLAAALGAAAMRLDPLLASEGPNLLEKWIRESRKHLRPILLRSAAPLAAMLLVALTMFGLNVSLDMSNARLEREVAKAEPVKIRYNHLRLDLIAADAKLRSLLELQQSLPRPELERVVQGVGQCLPNDVWLERLTITDGTDSAINGAGFTDSGVYEFVGHLEKLPGASSVALQETGVRQSPEGPNTSFSMTAQFGAPAAAAVSDQSPRGEQH